MSLTKNNQIYHIMGTSKYGNNHISYCTGNIDDIYYYYKDHPDAGEGIKIVRVHPVDISEKLKQIPENNSFLEQEINEIQEIYHNDNYDSCVYY